MTVQNYDFLNIDGKYNNNVMFFNCFLLFFLIKFKIQYVVFLEYEVRYVRFIGSYCPSLARYTLLPRNGQIC
jgi:hypothetical protein